MFCSCLQYHHQSPSFKTYVKARFPQPYKEYFAPISNWCEISQFDLWTPVQGHWCGISPYIPLDISQRPPNTVSLYLLYIVVSLTVLECVCYGEVLTLIRNVSFLSLTDVCGISQLQCNSSLITVFEMCIRLSVLLFQFFFFNNFSIKEV